MFLDFCKENLNSILKKIKIIKFNFNSNIILRIFVILYNYKNIKF